MVTNYTLCRTATRVFGAHSHTIYIAKILWAKNIVYNKRSVYNSRISYYRHRIIHIQLLDNSYPSDITNIES
jgi:hypothetical protein